MAASGCKTPLGICAVRISRLNADGSVVALAGASTGAVSVRGNIAQLDWKGVYVTGDDIAELDGCGNLAVVRKYQDKLKRFDVTLNFLVQSHELREISYDATLLSDGGNVDGHADLIATACGTGVAQKHGVCVEAWAENWKCNQPDPVYPYQRIVFSRCFFNPSDGTLKRGANPFIITGYTQANDNILNGPFNDFPASLSSLTSWTRAAFEDTALPTASVDCGYATTPSQT